MVGKLVETVSPKTNFGRISRPKIGKILSEPKFSVCQRFIPELIFGIVAIFWMVSFQYIDSCSGKCS